MNRERSGQKQTTIGTFRPEAVTRHKIENMRIVALPTTWNKAEGLIPLEAQDIDIYATATELDALAAFFTSAASALRETGRCDSSLEFGDSKPDAQTGIWVNIKGAST